MAKLYVDMDGVLADFDTGYERIIGIRPDKEKDNVDWALVRSVPGFYRDLPLMPDADVLWRAIAPLNPAILTGVPKSVPEAAANKFEFIEKHSEVFGNAECICCLSKNKWQICRSGDILIDDWEKYRKRWIDAGGRWITHVSAEQTLRQLHLLGVLPISAAQLALFYASATTVAPAPK